MCIRDSSMTGESGGGDRLPKKPTAEKEEAVFEAARTLPREQRADYLDKACGADASLRRRIDKLLQSDEEAGDFLAPASSPTGPNSTVVLSLQVTEKPGDI